MACMVCGGNCELGSFCKGILKEAHRLVQAKKNKGEGKPRGRLYCHNHASELPHGTKLTPIDKTDPDLVPWCVSCTNWASYEEVSE